MAFCGLVFSGRNHTPAVVPISACAQSGGSQQLLRPVLIGSLCTRRASNGQTGGLKSDVAIDGRAAQLAGLDPIAQIQYAVIAAKQFLQVSASTASSSIHEVVRRAWKPHGSDPGTLRYIPRCYVVTLADDGGGDAELIQRLGAPSHQHWTRGAGTSVCHRSHHLFRRLCAHWSCFVLRHASARAPGMVVVARLRRHIHNTAQT